MKIEIDGNTTTAIVVVSIAAVIISIAFLIHLSSAVPFREGYSQKQLESSLSTMWIKEQPEQ